MTTLHILNGRVFPLSAGTYEVNQVEPVWCKRYGVIVKNGVSYDTYYYVCWFLMDDACELLMFCYLIACLCKQIQELCTEINSKDYFLGG